MKKIIWWLSDVQVTSVNLCDCASVTDKNLQKNWREGIIMTQNKVERAS